MTMTSSLTLQAAPEIERIRHDLKRRELTVQSVERLTPAMLRITFEGDDLADFVSLGYDDHVKLIIPVEGSEHQLREYTPRRYDNEARTLVIDFAVHDAGPATLWALSAKPGDTLTVGGPRGSAVISAAVTDWLLIGDETALPAIGRRIEEAVKGMRMTAILAVPSPADQQAFETDAELSVHWVYRSVKEAASPAPVLTALQGLDIAPGTFVFIAAEAGVAKAIRHHLVEERGHPLGWTKAAGYWTLGKADASEKFG
jgi:NADPH-dependent ferric siderophore reductase